MAEPGIRVKPASLREFLVACDRVGPEMEQEMRSTLNRVGNFVRSSAAARMAPKHAPSAAGYKTVVYGSGRRVRVIQSRKKTGRRPDWGGWQMRNTLLPALYGNLGRVRNEFGVATDRVTRRFEAR
jgi:hypothetical protein